MGLEQQHSHPLLNRAAKILIFAGLAGLATSTSDSGHEPQYFRGNFNIQLPEGGSGDKGTADLRSNDDKVYYYITNDTADWRGLSGQEVEAEVDITGPHYATVRSMILVHKSRP